MTVADRVEVRRLDGVLGGLELLRADFRRQSFAPHFHEDYTFGLITRGANRFRYGHDRLVAPAGTLCLAMPGEVHTGDAVEGGWSYWTVHVKPEILAGLGVSERIGTPVFASGVIADAEAARRFTAFFAGAARSTALADEVRAVEALGFLIGRHAVVRPIKPAQVGAAVASRVRDFLASRAEETVTLEELETEAGVSRFRLIRAFRAAYGLPPHAWQVQVRLERARTLIRSGVSIAAAAAETGFSDQAHLTRTFKKSYGYTPGILARCRGS